MQDPNTEFYSPGDPLKRTPFYDGNYPSWTITEGTVISVKKLLVQDSDLGKEERPMYRGRYGFQKEYPSFSIFLQGTDGNVYIVSQLGFNHDGS